MKPNILVFDVESTSLHGTAFAVGAIVVTREGEEIDKFELLSKEGLLQASDWVKENVVPHLSDMPFCNTDRELRDQFYSFYLLHKDSSEIWADCCFPVETNFLSEIVKDDFEAREFNMPYPLKDISTIVDIDIDRAFRAGMVGLRKHNPLDDSIASSIILLESLDYDRMFMEKRLNNQFNTIGDYQERLSRCLGKSYSLSGFEERITELKALNECELIASAEYGYNYHKISQFPDLEFEEMCRQNFLQVLQIRTDVVTLENLK